MYHTLNNQNVRLGKAGSAQVQQQREKELASSVGISLIPPHPLAVRCRRVEIAAQEVGNFWAFPSCLVNPFAPGWFSLGLLLQTHRIRDDVDAEPPVLRAQLA